MSLKDFAVNLRGMLRPAAQGNGSASAPPPAPKAKAGKPADTFQASGSTSWQDICEVKRGDKVKDIAKRHGTTVAELTRVNSLDGGPLSNGQKLLVPTQPKGPDQFQSNASSAWHDVVEVRRGDKLDRIARHYGTTVAELTRVNSLDGGPLSDGQKLLVPEKPNP